MQNQNQPSPGPFLRFLGTSHRFLFKVFFVCLLLVGLVFLAISCFTIAHTAFFVRSSSETLGIIERVEATEVRGGYNYRPVYSFTGSRNIRHEAKGRNAGKPRFEKGQSVPVIFNPSNPAESEIKTFHDIWFGPCLLGGMSTASVSVLLWKRRRMI